MINFKSWLAAFRLRTLPLAMSSVFMGSFVALYQHEFKWPVFILAVFTTLFLQVLSNLANDYGDAVNGADTADRKGPQRMVQSGRISPLHMKRMIIFFVVCSFLSGISLIAISLGHNITMQVVVFLVIGLLAIGAALKYTMGSNPYGYRGLGDLYVFVFFGLVGVLGTYYLHTGRFELGFVLPAIAVGLLSAGVLNVNNMRDVDTDAQTGKHTMVVKFGIRTARFYHLSLMVGSFFAMVLFMLVYSVTWPVILSLFGYIPLLFHTISVFRGDTPQKLDPELKVLALTTFFIVLLFGLGVSLSSLV